MYTKRDLSVKDDTYTDIGAGSLSTALGQRALVGTAHGGSAERPEKRQARTVAVKYKTRVHVCGALA